jgi:hypothetical protein
MPAYQPAYKPTHKQTNKVNTIILKNFLFVCVACFGVYKTNQPTYKTNKPTNQKLTKPQTNQPTKL